MRSFAVAAVAVFAFGCGDVLKVPDAGPADAYEPDSPTAPSCTAPETLCNGSCANLMNSELYCGNCNTQCVPTEGCLNGACVPANVSCRRVRELDPAATDGVYVNPNNNGSFYCDYTAGQQWEIVTNPFTVSPGSGFTVARATTFTQADFVAAFIALYNHDIGFRTVTTFQTSNCCMAPISGSRYSFGAQILFTGVGTSIFCNQQINAGTYVSFGRNGNTPLATLPANFFATFPVTEVTDCGDGNNAAFWFKKTTI